MSSWASPKGAITHILVWLVPMHVWHVHEPHKTKFITLLGIIIVGLLTTGKNKNREKYGEIAQNPPHYPGRNFTSAKPFNFKIAEITRITEI